MNQAARQLCLKLVERWLAKDATPFKDEVARLVSEEWAIRGLSADKLIEALQQACAKTLGETPEVIFGKLTEPLNSLDIAKPEEAKQTLAGVFKCIDEILGKPEEFMGSAPGTLAEPMLQSAETRVTHWSTKLAAFAVSLVEQPEYRLAGAEAAFRELVSTIEKVCTEQEPLVKEFATRSQDARERIAKLLESLSNPAAARRNINLLPNLIELVRAYPRWRLQWLVLQRVSAAYVSLRGALSDQLREVNYCRERLHEMRRRLDEAPKEHVSLSGTMLTRALLPEGCRTLAESVEALRRRFTTEDINDLDKSVQNVISQDFSSLVQVCLGSANRLKELERSMMRLAMDCVGTRIGNAEVADIYLAQYEKDDQVRDDLASMFTEATPRLGEARQGSEIAVLAAPASPAGGKVRRLAQQAVPDTELGESESTDDIVFYRERFQMLLSELEQLGPLGYEAYRQVGMVDSFTPHSRTDVTQWRAAGAN